MQELDRKCLQNNLKSKPSRPTAEWQRVEYMDWQSIVSGILAGGLAGQIITLIGTDRLTYRRDYRKWLVAERMKLFSELLSISTTFQAQKMKRKSGPIKSGTPLREYTFYLKAEPHPNR